VDIVLLGFFIYGFIVSSLLIIRYFTTHEAVVLFAGSFFAPIFALFTAIIARNLVRRITKSLWTYSMYFTDKVEQFTQVLKDALDKRGFKYGLRTLRFRRGYEFIIEKPFKARVEVLKWTHRSWKYRFGAKPPTGTIIHVSPHPERANKEFAEIMAEVFWILEMLDAYDDWRRRTEES